MKILILCTGNSCRSQMAHGFLQSLDPRLQVFSAGTQPADRVNPLAVQVMHEAGIDISHHIPAHVNQYLGEPWDFVITVCGGANESCPVFIGTVKSRLHFGFEDPSNEQGTPQHIMEKFHQVRDAIKTRFHEFYRDQVQPLLPER
ncbi:MAG: arsenate reductase ArsC [Desulfocapsaceae bacterium]|nr:arsenate reductase ArsC [Desulfocapsaceae bacterium]